MRAILILLLMTAAAEARPRLFGGLFRHRVTVNQSQSQCVGPNCGILRRSVERRVETTTVQRKAIRIAPVRRSRRCMAAPCR